MMIVMGASLGGTKVLRTILRALPKSFPHPIAIALHRSRDAQDEGVLVQLLQRDALLPISEPMDKEPILGGHIYISPADYHLMVDVTGFSLSTDDPVQYARPSIDVLFESAGDAFDGETVAVILTGASQDGARGAVHIAERGGLIVAQDPTTAESATMPLAAIRATGTTHVYGPRDIGLFLSRLDSRSVPVKGRS